MSYVDGFLIPLPKKNIKAYRTMAQWGKKTWMKYGALDYKECVGDDLKNAMGIAFPKVLKTKPGETVVFAYIVFKSRKHRDSVNKKVMSDPAMNDPKMMTKMPFDPKRMCYGGFSVIVDAKQK
ncbi:MAG: DUF1428 domain-containing protein [Candidatus Peribacteraceae bacterium]|nr:DUF1428 domain-containing protein [Candidatus Peribacteraceae bacterium]